MLPNSGINLYYEGEVDLDRYLRCFMDNLLNNPSVDVSSSSLVRLPSFINPVNLFDFLVFRPSGRTTATGTGECCKQYLEILPSNMPLNSDRPRVPTIKSEGWYMAIIF